MKNESKNCSCTEADATANARLVGLLEEFQSGTFTCCQVAQWAEEQRAAWLQAMWEDFNNTNEETEADENGVPVPVRRRQKNADAAQS